LVPKTSKLVCNLRGLHRQLFYFLINFLVWVFILSSLLFVIAAVKYYPTVTINGEMVE
jgi:hypothetical protein